MIEDRVEERELNAVRQLRVAVVGACATGKSTLVAALRRSGYEARHVAQEHSYVPEMWRIIGRPDVLIYLDAAFEVIVARRPRSGLRLADVEEQRRRLEHARQNCHLYLDTSALTPGEVESRALAFLESPDRGSSRRSEI